MSAERELPAVILVHGGGCTAALDWVTRWTERGYAALALDTGGFLPTPDLRGDVDHKGRPLNLRTEYSGPQPYGFDRVGQPLREQWPYHAVTAIIRGHSLLRSFPPIDPQRVGIVGVSWGGFLACLAAGLDHRLAMAVSVYGCGFVHEDSVWADNELTSLPTDQQRRWAAHWDPSTVLGQASLPMLWVTGTNDFAYVLGSLQKSYRLKPAPSTLSVRVGMPHDRSGGWVPENFAFADQHLRHGLCLPDVSAIEMTNDTASCQWNGPTPIAKAELAYTLDRGAWQTRDWRTLPAQIDQRRHRVQVKVPHDASTFFINLHDRNDLAVSTPHVERSLVPAPSMAY